MGDRIWYSMIIVGTENISPSHNRMWLLPHLTHLNLSLKCHQAVIQETQTIGHFFIISPFNTVLSGTCIIRNKLYHMIKGVAIAHSLIYNTCGICTVNKWKNLKNLFTWTLSTLTSHVLVQTETGSELCLACCHFIHDMLWYHTQYVF